MANLVVYKGDDTTGIFGRHLQFTITVQEGVSLVGCVAKFTVHKITKSWSNITPGQQVEIIYTHDETASMPVGGTYGIFQIVDASNNIRTFDDSVPFLVTNDIRQVYPGSSQATVYVGQMIKWTDIAGRPATVVQKVNNTLPDTNGNVDDEAGIRSICTMINTIKNLLKPQTALLALFAILSTTLSGAYVETNKLVNLLGKSNVVTAVSFEGLATTNELTTVKTNLEDKISKAAPADYTTTNAVKSIAADASVTNAGAVAVAAADATAKANAAREQAKAASLSLADGGVITNNVRITGMYALKFGNTSDDGGNVNFSTVEQCFNSESPNYGRLLLSSAELMIWQEPIAIMSDITDAITPATNDASIVRYKNGTLKHGTNTVVATEVGALPATNPNDSEMKVAWDSVSLNLSGGYFYASSAKFMYNDVFDGSGTTSLRDELDALAPKSMISATDATFVTATTNAVANSDNLWNQSNAKLTTRITQVVSNYVDRTNAHFSNEVLAVGLNVPSNTIAAINYMATNDTLVAVLGEFAENPPIDPTTGATTVGGLLAALAAAVAWLKRETLKKGLSEQGIPTDTNVASLFTGENTSLVSATRYQNHTPTIDSPTISGTVETTSVTVSPDKVESVSVPAPASGNTTALAISVNGDDTLGVRNVILDVTNGDTAAACAIGIVDATARVFKDGAAEIPKGVRAIVTLTKLPTSGEPTSGEPTSGEPTSGEWLVSVNELASAS